MILYWLKKEIYIQKFLNAKLVNYVKCIEGRNILWRYIYAIVAFFCLFINVKVKWTKNLAFEQVALKLSKRLHFAHITTICPDNGFAPHALKI